jgi:glycerophosphoryl diester phosphodiesterase
MWRYPKVIAHRGGGTRAPENTIAALRCGLAHGFHAVEFDVMLSADGIPVLMHDPLFGRTVAGPGSVAESSAQALMAMDAGRWFDAQYAGECVPSFSAVVEFCTRHRIWMNVEIKPAPGHEAATGRAAAACLASALSEIKAAGIPEPLFSSFSFEALSAAKQAAPEIPRGFLLGAIADDWQERLRQLEAVALHTNHKTLSRERAQEVKQAGYGLFCYTVNEPARAREILSWGVDAFCTDRIDLIGPDFR